MGKINLLEDKVFNRIAAGEVVERPASVVKELVENSLDASATQIRVEVLEGGIKQIKVTDNGSGIEKEDLEKAFMPHATSKIKTVEDLEKIGTLGFRGEALASIANVSQIEATSKIEENDTGKRVKIEGGVLLENKEVASPNGTYITVNNLFFNVPARKKFLKSPKREESEITNLMSRLIFANPNISFVYLADKREIYRSTGKNLEEAIFTVYGKSTLENILPFENNSGEIKLSGYLGKPNFSKSNRTYQTLIINGRYVVNSVVSAASYGAYQNYLMKGKFPFFIIHMNLPLDSLDVNVHPNKLDVKFENSQAIYGLIYNAITNALMNANNILKVETKTQPEKSQIVEPKASYASEEGASFSQSEDAPKQVELTNESIIDEEQTDKKAKIISSFMNFAEGSLNSKSLKENSSLLTSALHKALSEVDNEIPQKQVQTSAFESIKLDRSNLIMVGKVFNTYIMIEKDNSLFLIDQHAAHEKLLYDELTEQLNNRQLAVQGLLVPHILSVNHLEEAFLLENLGKIKALGFEIEPFGSLSFKISTVPSVLAQVNIDLFFNEILKDMTALNKNKTSELIIDRLKQASCKAAVKGGNNLNMLEIETLFNKMIESNMVLLCPHGRPIVVEVTRKELDKWFKRIL
jgi:DNA mismatch repair protein MutL